ncbi:hypothetical protein [Paracidovorax avenae]|uniref:hypothetical protein n=1 Tax=Paracidovorax avenae TaxID=80867 RepID=UPI0012603D96|nr:hypothetical protein [Paracidovorax avenae]
MLHFPAGTFAACDFIAPFSGAEEKPSAGCIFFRSTVNAPGRRRVVDASKELTMNTSAILSAWPEDERDRKRAPGRF